MTDTTLKDLIIAVDWSDLLQTFCSLYPEEEKNIEGYKNVFEYIKAHDSEQSEKHMRILIDYVATDDITKEALPLNEQYYHVNGKNGELYKDDPVFIKQNDPVGEQEMSWGLELSSLEQWGGYLIDKETLNKYHASDIICHCLYEMTFFGFNNDTILEYKNGLKSQQEEIAKWEDEGTIKDHTKTWEQMKIELNINSDEDNKDV